MSLTLESRVERLNTLVSEGRIARSEWTGTDADGRETACLLAALSPEAGEAENPGLCPAEVMPGWFAHITPWMDDNCSTSEWPRVIRRYAACAARWSVLDDAAWRRVEITARRVAVIKAMRHTSDEQVLTACRQVLAWLDADMSESSQVDVKEAAAKVAAARDAARAAAAWATWTATRAAAAVTRRAEEAWAAWAAAAAARAAAVEAPWAAEAAATAAVKGVAEAAKSEAADRITDEILSALEKECGL